MRVTEPTKPAALRITNGIEAKRLIMRSQQQLQQQQQAMQKQKPQQQQQEGIRRKWFVPAAGVRQNQNSSTAGQVDKPRVVMVKTNPMNNMMQQRSQYQQQQARPNVVVTSSNSNAAAPSSSSTTTHSLKMNGATSSMHGAANYRKGVAAGIKATTTAAGNAASYSAAGMQNLVGAAAAGGGIQLSTLPAQHLQVVQQLYERLLQNPQQMANLIKTLPPQTGQALAELLRQYAVSSAPTASGMMGNRSSSYGQQQQGTAPKQHNNRSIQIVKPNQQQQFPIRQNPTTTMMNKAQIEAASKRAQEQLVQQNIARARLQVRREFDSMVYKLPVLKAPPPDLFFIPNGNHPAFPYFLGLDLTVQWVLGDKQMFRKPNVKPYRCEECETDFTPSWKAICGEKEGCHLYCEKCVRQAQKRKVCRDYKQQLQRAFQLIKEREKQLLAQAAHQQQQQNLQSQHQPHQRMATATASNSSTSSSAGATGAPFLQSQRKRTWHVCR